MKICFVSYNGCIREFMAEYICKHLVKELGLEDQIEVTSMGFVSDDRRIGAPLPDMWKILKENGIEFEKKKPIFLTRGDYDKYDLFIGMEQIDLDLFQEIKFYDPKNKLKRLLDFTGIGKDINDPWDTHNYESAYYNIYTGCKAMLRSVTGIDFD